MRGPESQLSTGYESWANDSLLRYSNLTREAMASGSLEVELDLIDFKGTLERLKYVAYYHTEVIQVTSDDIKKTESDNETLLQVDGLFYEAENFTAPVSQQQKPESEEHSSVVENMAVNLEDVIDIARTDIKRVFGESSEGVSEAKTTIADLADQYPPFTDVTADFISVEAVTLESYAKGKEAVKIPYHFALFTLNYLESLYEALGSDESSELTDLLQGKNAGAFATQLITMHKGLAELRGSEYLCQYYSERGLDVNELDVWLVKCSDMIIRLEQKYYPH